MPAAQAGAAAAEVFTDPEDVELLAAVAAAARSTKPLSAEEAAPPPGTGRACARREVRAPATSASAVSFEFIPRI